MSTRTPRSGGFTLLEIMIALSVMVIAIVGLVSVITYTTTANQVNRENVLAMRAAEAKVEEMRQWDVSTVFVRYAIDIDIPLHLAALNNPALFPFALAQLDTSGAPTKAHYPGPNFGVDPNPAPDPFDGKYLSNDPTFMPLWSDKANFSATISFPKAVADPAWILRENLPGPTEPDTVTYDLNLNGVTGENATADYRVLPATITISWRGIKGARTLTYRYLFLKRT